jgi:hypothetical protein
MRNQLIGGPDMTQRIVHAEELLASYEKEKEKIDWQKPSYWGAVAGPVGLRLETRGGGG